jgi:hypothetical protein
LGTPGGTDDAQSLLSHGTLGRCHPSWANSGIPILSTPPQAVKIEFQRISAEIKN